ncbi:MAG: PAS domain-containing protein [Sulfuriflexus sp.]|nr:PAS domain-containing protein [Sulfuriflexus sp.]
MATKKKSNMGYDPLAWMQEDDASPEAKKKPAAKKKSAKKPIATVPYVSPLGLDVELLESSFDALAPNANKLAKRFYEELFARYPAVKPMFANTTPAKQQKKLVAALVLVVKSLRKPDALVEVLKNLGGTHQGYGAEPAHYEAVASTMLDVMEEFAGDLWTDEVHAAWQKALETIATTMLTGYTDSEDNTMANAKLETTETNEALTRMQSAIDGAATAIMMIDRDFIITYANAATIKILKDNEEELRRVYPGFSADAALGTCIDTFHKNPAHQRQLLADPNNLPYKTDIQVGPLTFALNVTAQITEDGEYIGNSLEWSDVTEARKSEANVARLQGTVDGAMTAIMMIDRDFNITYANKSTTDMLKGHEATLQQAYPGFSVDKILGANIDQFHKNPAHQRQLLGDPNNLPYSTDINVGPLTFALNVTAIMENGNYVGNALEWSDVTELRAKEEEVARLTSAVDGAEANLMLCDNDLNITFANPAVVEMLRKRQVELRTIWPGLDVDNLLGTCIDGFHKNPAHQRALLSDPARLPATAEISVGGLNFRVNATMIKGPNGEYMGNMVQWTDITEQIDAEKQIQALIDGATKGELDTRIDHENYQGFMKGLGEGINNLMDAVVDPLKGGMDVMQALSSGDLTRSMDGEYQGEFAILKDSINGTVNNLIDVVGNIRQASTSIASASGEISQGNINLSQRTEEQASSLEETASSMEELTGTVKQNADNARQANQLAAGARDQAEKGGAVVGDAITAMSEINSASKKIADIISVIDEIAFQTNLLALNAAVEAARAGEQGRGFAVVASEVRNLAQRSAGAAKEIKSLINDSVEKVDEGSRLVNESGQTLDEIVGAVKKVSDIIAEIAAASLEQSTGIEQVNQTVSQMDEVTQQNAALVEEAAAASESLDEQARELDQLMTYFKLSGADANRAPAAAAAPASRPAPVAARPAARRPAGAIKAAPATDNDSEWEEF